MRIHHVPIDFELTDFFSGNRLDQCDAWNLKLAQAAVTPCSEVPRTVTFPGQHDFTDASRNTPPRIHPGVHGHTDNAGSSHDQKDAGRPCCHKPLGHHRARSCIDIHPASGGRWGQLHETRKQGNLKQEEKEGKEEEEVEEQKEQKENAQETFGSIPLKEKEKEGEGGKAIDSLRGRRGSRGDEWHGESGNTGAGQRERGAQLARVGLSKPGGRRAAAVARRGLRDGPPAAAAAFAAATATALCWAVRLRAAAAGAAAAAAAIVAVAAARVAARTAGRVAGRVLWGALGAVGVRAEGRKGGAAATGEPSL